MIVIKFGTSVQLVSKYCFRDRKNSCRLVKGVTKMSKIDEALRTRRIVTLFFAFLSGISAVSTAVVPAILHI
jgi:hypothetical protein